MYYDIGKALFQSTPPVKAATRAKQRARLGEIISIHAAREGGDGMKDSIIPLFDYFNPRRP